VLINGDCLEIMPTLPAKSVDLILCDLPYGSTFLAWDSVIPFVPLWTAYKRLLKPNGCVILNACQPFTSALVMSNPKWFRNEIIWAKGNSTGFLDCRRKPLRKHESILVFAPGKKTYNPQMTAGTPYTQKRGSCGAAMTGDPNIINQKRITANLTGDRYPVSVQHFEFNKEPKLHPTQKPLSMATWLIKTYSNEGDTIMDNCFGSGTNLIAAHQEGRKYIGIEKDEHYYQIGCDRLDRVKK
jgi:site-specific DNA-methyltransferase (adenine-specific)